MILCICFYNGWVSDKSLLKSSKSYRHYPCGPLNANNPTLLGNKSITRAATISARLVYDNSTHAHRGSVGAPITNKMPNLVSQMRHGKKFYVKSADHTSQAGIVENTRVFHPEKSFDSMFFCFLFLVFFDVWGCL